MLKQLLVTIVVLVLAVAGYVFLVPGARENLARVGITVPGGETSQQSGGQTAGPPQGRGAGGPGGQGAPGGQRGGGARTITVATKPVTSSIINNKLSAIGDGSALHSVTVTSQSGGTLNELLVSPGDVVKAGDIIGHLDSQAEQIAFDKASLAAKNAEDALKRSTELQKSNSVSAAALTTAQLANDQAALDFRNAKLALDRRSIVAPIGGTVGLMQVTPGNYLSSNAAVTTIEDDSQLLVTFWVPERFAPLIKPGMAIEASATALPGQTFTGSVNAIDNRVDPASRTLQVQALIPNDQKLMRAGMSFAVTLDFPGEQFASVDPLAIQWSAAGPYVWKLAEGKVGKGMVQIVQRNSDGILVTGDVKEGEEVVTEGVLQLSDGSAVRVLGQGGGQQGQGNGQQGQGQGQGAQGQGQTQGNTHKGGGQQPAATQQ